MQSSEAHSSMLARLTRRAPCRVQRCARDAFIVAGGGGRHLLSREQLLWRRGLEGF